MEDFIWKAVGICFIILAAVLAANQDCIILYGHLCK